MDGITTLPSAYYAYARRISSGQLAALAASASAALAASAGSPAAPSTNAAPRVGSGSEPSLVHTLDAVA